MSSWFSSSDKTGKPDGAAASGAQPPKAPEHPARFSAHGHVSDPSIAAIRADTPVVGNIPVTREPSAVPNASASIVTTVAPSSASGGEPELLDVEVIDANGGSGGVHEITRSINYWFAREVGQLETFAKSEAHEWAAKGLPRHDVERDQELPPEQVIAGRCDQLFRDWADRVRVKMQDAIEQGSQQVGSHVAGLRGAVARLEGVHADAAAAERDIRELQRVSEKDADPVHYEKLFRSAAGFWIFAGLLALVEFFANYPVFRLLLPMDTALAEQARMAVQDAADGGMWAGFRLLAMDMAFHLEAVFVALVAVLILVLLGKTLGSSARPLFAMSEEEHPLASRTIRAHKRQHRVAMIASALGATLVLGFLYKARGEISTTAQTRVTADSLQVRDIERQIAALPPGSLTQSTDLARRHREASRALVQHQDDRSYATTVERNNEAILLLNIALVLAAAVLGYSHKAEDLTGKQGEHPDLPALRAKLDSLRKESLELAGEARVASGHARAGISRVRHLLSSHPLREWKGKEQRLQGVIPMFRSENARARGLDPATVAAFRTPCELTLPTVNDAADFTPPAEFSRLQDEFDDLSVTFARLAGRTTPPIPHLAVA